MKFILNARALILTEYCYSEVKPAISVHNSPALLHKVMENSCSIDWAEANLCCPMTFIDSDFCFKAGHKGFILRLRNIFPRQVRYIIFCHDHVNQSDLDILTRRYDKDLYICLGDQHFTNVDLYICLGISVWPILIYIFVWVSAFH